MPIFCVRPSVRPRTYTSSPTRTAVPFRLSFVTEVSSAASGNNEAVFVSPNSVYEICREINSMEQGAIILPTTQQLNVHFGGINIIFEVFDKR